MTTPGVPDSASREPFFAYHRQAVTGFFSLPRDVQKGIDELGERMRSTSVVTGMVVREGLHVVNEPIESGRTVCRFAGTSRCGATASGFYGGNDNRVGIYPKCKLAMINTPDQPGRPVASVSVTKMVSGEAYSGPRVFDGGCYDQLVAMGQQFTETIRARVDLIQEALPPPDNY